MIAYRDFLTYRSLLWNLALRDIRIRYKQALLGVGWAILQPLCLMILFSFVFSRVTRVDTGNIPYPLFAYAGLVPWQFFQLGVSTATLSLVQNTALVTKIYCPRTVFPFAAILSKMLDFLIAFAVLLVLMVAFGQTLHETVLWIPLLLGLQVLLMAGIGLVAAMGNIFYRDVGYVMNTLLLLWMFATPVVYPLPPYGIASTALLLVNPMSALVNAYRDVLLKGLSPDWMQLAPAAIVSTLIFVLGWYLFHRFEHLFAERI